MRSTFGRQVVLTLFEAYRSATREKARQVGTDRILIAVTMNASISRSVGLPDDGGWRLRRAAVRATSITADVDEQATSAFDDAIQKEIDRTLREVTWRVVHQFGRRSRAPAPPSPMWSGAVRGTLGRALMAARAQDAPYAGATDLLDGLLTDDRNRASALLRSVGADPASIVDRLRADPTARAVVEPYAPVVASLELAGGVVLEESPILWLVRAVMRRRMTRRSRYGSAVLACLELEMMRQAVREDVAIVAPAHALLAIGTLDDQLASAGRSLIARSAPFNRGGDVLHRLGVDRPRLLGIVADGLVESARSASVADPSRRFWAMARPAWGVEVSGRLDRSIVIARERGHPETGTSHLLAALLEDDGPHSASRLLRALGADTVEARGEVDRVLSVAALSRS
jgi:hypothetical protein